MKNFFLYIVTALFLVSCGGSGDKKGHGHNHAKNEETHKHMHKDGEKHGHNKDKAVSTDCRNCGMPSSEFPKWRSKVTTKGGDVWFCSPRCMFITTLDKEKAPKEIQGIRVVDYYSTKSFDAKTAYYVTGSDILGPMGHDFVPVKDKAAADDFKKEHKGDKVLKFDEVSLETVKAIVKK